MIVPAFIYPNILEHFPKTVTVLVTYGCTAACEQCCFESNPSIKERLSLQQIKNAIQEAADTFPALRMIAFSGGEAFMLKDDLIEAIRFATSLGLMTRVVSNGYWAKNEFNAKRLMKKASEAGLTELNISTGLDHQKWVTRDTVIHAVTASVSEGIFTLVTVEQDSEQSGCMTALLNDKQIQSLLKDPRFTLMTNSWMAFHDDAEPRKSLKDNLNRDLYGGCSQLFTSVVVTPHNNLSACCGLTLEHIPEMRLGSLKESSISQLYEQQLLDFLKIWIHVDGPMTIIKSLFGEGNVQKLGEMRHICQACAIMHQSKEIRTAIRERYLEFVPDVLQRFNSKLALLDYEAANEQQRERR